MHFKLTQEMKQRIIVYSTSFIIAILFFTILNKFKDIKRAIQFILTILFPFLLGIGLAFILNNPQFRIRLILCDNFLKTLRIIPIL